MGSLIAYDEVQTGFGHNVCNHYDAIGNHGYDSGAINAGRSLGSLQQCFQQLVGWNISD